MSGHSKWSNIKYKKSITDAKKSKIFSKLAKIIGIAARHDPNPESNPSLRTAIDKAKSFNLPKANIEKILKRAGSSKGGEELSSITYEAYGPVGVALLIETITDNQNRTLGELKIILSRFDGKIAEKGSVKWSFEQKGIIGVKIDKENNKNAEEVELSAIEAGAEDIGIRPNGITEIITKPQELYQIKKTLEIKNIKIETAEIGWLPKNELDIKEPASKEKLQKLFEALDEQEDVQEIYSNAKL